MKKKNKIEIVNSSFFEDLLWMSYRYCIGRHTIAAHSHAGEIAKNAYHVLSEDRKFFMAHDIRKEINDVLHLKKNVRCLDYRNHIYNDGVSLIIEETINKYGKQLPNGFDFDHYEYDINNGKVKVIEWGEGILDYQKFTVAYEELLPWIKLANAFDSSCHKKLTVNVDGKNVEYEVMPFPYINVFDKTIDKKWISIERYLENPIVCSYFNEEAIVKIEDLDITF